MTAAATLQQARVAQTPPAQELVQGHAAGQLLGPLLPAEMPQRLPIVPAASVAATPALIRRVVLQKARAAIRPRGEERGRVGGGACHPGRNGGRGKGEMGSSRLWA